MYMIIIHNPHLLNQSLIGNSHEILVATMSTMDETNCSTL